MTSGDDGARPILLNPVGVRRKLAAMAALATMLERSARLVEAAVSDAAAGDPEGWLTAGTAHSSAAAGRLQAQIVSLRALLADAEATLQAVERAARGGLTLALTSATQHHDLAAPLAPPMSLTPTAAAGDGTDAPNSLPFVAALILPPPNEPELRQLAEQISKTRNTLVQRYQEMREDKEGLYPTDPAVKPGIGSWTGHKTQYNGWRQRLKNLLAEWQRKGGFTKYPEALPADADDWSETPPPTQPAPIVMLPPAPRTLPLPAPVPTPPLVQRVPTLLPPAPGVPPFPAPAPTRPPILQGPSPVPAPTPLPFPAPTPRPVPPVLTRGASAIGPSGEQVLLGAGAAVGGIGLGYLIYRGVRLLPSLAPPLWPTLPANLAIP